MSMSAGKAAAEGCVFKTKERFLQAVTEYTHPTQPCEFVTFEGGFAFLQRGVSEITVREWVCDDEISLAETLCHHYHLPVRIQDRVVLPDVLSLFLSDLRKLADPASAVCIVQNIEIDIVSLAPCLCHDTVFLFSFGLDADIVLRNPVQHILALANVDDLPVDLNTIDSGTLILCPQSFAL